MARDASAQPVRIYVAGETLHRAADDRSMPPMVKERQRRVSQHLFKACAPTIRLLNLAICSRVQTLLHRKWMGISYRNRAGPAHPATGDTRHSEWSQINSPLDRDYYRVHSLLLVSGCILTLAVRRSLRLMALIRGTALHCPQQFGKKSKWFSALVRISSIMGGSGESES